jgi:ribosome-binding factor A
MARKRNARVDRDVRAAIADALGTEVADPRLALVTITEVDVTPDHEVATVYYSTLDPDLMSSGRSSSGPRPARADQVATALEAAAPMLRGIVGRRVKLRVTPELRFRPDPVVEQVEAVERLLRDVQRGPTPDSSGTAPGAASGEPSEGGR